MSSIYAGQPLDIHTNGQMQEPPMSVATGDEPDDVDVPRAVGLSELWVWAVVTAVLLTVTYRDPESIAHQTAWILVTILSVAYILSRGFAKLGGEHRRTPRRSPYDT